MVATALAALGDAARRPEIAREARRRLARLTWKRSAELFRAEVERALAA